MFTKNDKPLFALGKILVTQKAKEVPQARLKELLSEHRHGHWGFIEPPFAVINARSLANDTECVTSLHRASENEEHYLVLATNLDDGVTVVYRYEEAPEDVQARLRIGTKSFVALVTEREGYLH